MTRGFLKYLRLVFSFLKVSFIAEAEYRMNMLIRIIADMFWYVAQISVFEVLFRQSSQISSWTLPQTRIFLGVLFTVDGIYSFFFFENLDRISDKVSRGELDFILAKPINSQFMMSCQKISSYMIVNLIFCLGYLFYGLSQYRLLHPEQTLWAQTLWLLILIPVGVLVQYAIRFFFATMAIVLVRAENLSYLWYQIFKLGMRPDAIYPFWLRYIILTVIPVAFVASVPSRIILGSENYYLIPWALLIGALCIYGTKIYWNWALRHYTSASS